MTGFALLLVLAAAVVHATWNLLAKRAGGAAAFVWLYATAATVLWAPIALPVVVRSWHRMSPGDWVYPLVSGIIHIVYFLVLQKAYRVGDLSLVYPVARGTGPVLAASVAILFFGERPSLLALVGAALVCLSIFLFANPPAAPAPSRREAMLLGLLTGVLIACYTLWDKHAVSARGIPPLVMEWATNLTRMLGLLPIAFRNWKEVVLDWRAKRSDILWIGVLNPLAYLLVLTALSFSPVSYIAPAREVSILFGALFGAQFLKEADQKRRLAAAAVMVAGVVCLAVG